MRNDPGEYHRKEEERLIDEAVAAGRVTKYRPGETSDWDLKTYKTRRLITSASFRRRENSKLKAALKKGASQSTDG